MRNTLKQTVEGAKRPGYKPFKRTIGDALSQLASLQPDYGFIRDDLESLRKSTERRNWDIPRSSV